MRPDVTWIESPNFTPGRGLATIDSIVCHNTDGSFESAIDTFKTESSAVSAHYIVARDGRVVQMVLEKNTAWHAGDRAMNRRSIGIEHEADKNHTGLTPEQEKASLDLIGYLVGKYNIGLSYIHTHRVVDRIAGGTDCPKWVWPTEHDFAVWKEKIHDHVSH